jgi:hypothetical protein
VNQKLIVPTDFHEQERLHDDGTEIARSQWRIVGLDHLDDERVESRNL